MRILATARPLVVQVDTRTDFRVSIAVMSIWLVMVGHSRAVVRMEIAIITVQRKVRVHLGWAEMLVPMTITRMRGVQVAVGTMAAEALSMRQEEAVPVTRLLQSPVIKMDKTLILVTRLSVAL